MKATGTSESRLDYKASLTRSVPEEAEFFFPNAQYVGRMESIEYGIHLVLSGQHTQLAHMMVTERGYIRVLQPREKFSP